MKAPISSRDLTLLSAYLDHELSPRQQAQLEARLKDDPILLGVLAELRRTRAVLRHTPRLRAPRRFTLTPQMAAIRPAARRYPALGFASALASLLLVLALIGEALGLVGPSPATVALQKQPQLVETISGVPAEITPADAPAKRSEDQSVEEALATPNSPVSATALVESPPLPTQEIVASRVTTPTEETTVQTLLAPPAAGGEVAPTERYGAVDATTVPGFVPLQAATPTAAWLVIMTVTQTTTQTVEPTETATALPVEAPILPQETPQAAALAPSATSASQPQGVPAPPKSVPPAARQFRLMWRLGEAVLLVIALLTGAAALVLHLRPRR